MADTSADNAGRQHSEAARQVDERLVEQAREEGLDLVGPDGVLTGPSTRVREVRSGGVAVGAPGL